MPGTILIVEDEPKLAAVLEEYLRREGYRTEVARDGAGALQMWRSAAPDLILLDIMLPRVDGLEVARTVRASSAVPIIMLTARDEEVDKLVGLGLGADDYVVKPYSPREVVARVKAVLRRSQNALEPQRVLRVSDLEVDEARFRATCAGTVLDLTTSELRLLAALARSPGYVRSRTQLLEELAGDEDRFADERTIDAHVKNLRRKLGTCSDLIQTVRGVGYRLRDD
ncbi:MAG TPA: response regulator [Trueperaceae bacterium]|nr:response regulator [Trueperaceae bacterium]